MGRKLRNAMIAVGRLPVYLSAALLLAACLATIAPAASDAPAPGQRWCFWLLWVPQEAQVKAVGDKVLSGGNFMEAATLAHRTQAGESSFHADCLTVANLDAPIYAQLLELPLGGTSPVFPLKGGWALVMHTTDSHRRQAQELFDSGDFAGVEKALAEDLKLHPTSAPSWHLLALARSARNDPEGALRAFDHALIWLPGDPALLNDKAAILTGVGRRQEALALYQEAQKAQPGNPVVVANLAWALMLSGKDLDRAEQLARQAVELAPDKAAFWQTLGRIQQTQGAHAEAVYSFYRAAQLDPKEPQAGARLLMSLMALGPEKVASLSSQAPPPAAPLKAAAPETRPAKLAKPAPQLAQAAPGPAPAAPQPALPSLTAQPGPTAPLKPEQGEILRAYQPEPVTVRRPWTIAPAEPQPQPITTLPEPPKAKPAPAPVPKPVVAKAEPVTEAKPAPAPPVAKPEPAPEPVAKAEPTPIPKPEPTPAPAAVTPPPPPAAKPEPAPAPVVAKPEPVIAAKPEPVPATKPEPAPEPAAVTPPPPPVAKPEPASEPVAKAEPTPVPKPELTPAPPAAPVVPAPPPVAKPEPEPAPAPVVAKAEPVIAAKPEPAPVPAPEPPALAPAPKPPALATAPPAPAPEPGPPSASAPLRPGFYVQVSSYLAQGVAQKEVDNWNKAGYPALLSSLGSPGSPRWHRVLLGPHATRAQAQSLGHSLAARRFIGSFVVVEH